MKQSKYILLLSKSRINRDHKEKLFLDLNELKRINSCKIRYLSDLEVKGMTERYSFFLKIIPYQDLCEEAKLLFKDEGTPIGKIRFNGNQRKKTMFRLSTAEVRLLETNNNIKKK